MAQELKCSFCGKSQKQVELLIYEKKTKTYICNECVEICNELVADYRKEKLMKRRAESPLKVLKRICEETGVRPRPIAST